ncbi:MAG: formylmethanofuran dehydrogenase [Chloroflexi bacterium]|nr:formylmethanofuran dehydrogenase [Chloroflexota bacterium]
MLDDQPRLAECLSRSAALHERLCPRQVLGARMGLYAGELLELQLPRADKRLFTFIETDGCLADGLSAATGCWFGRRTLRLIDFGKVAATFVDTQNGRAVRICPHPDVRDRASVYAPEAPSHWHAQRDAYQCMPSHELLRASLVELLVPLNAILAQDAMRVVCVVCSEEISNGRQVDREGRPMCRECAGESYVRRHEHPIWKHPLSVHMPFTAVPAHSSRPY